MTTELMLLLGLFAFILVGTFLNRDTGLESTFKRSAPRLGARVEKHLETGAGFPDRWTAPPMPSGDVPDNR